MMEKILFYKTYSDSHTNGANRTYWAKFFKIISDELNETNKIHLYSSFNENMPIYEYYSSIKGRYVRIMQFNPQDEVVKSERYPANRFYTSWIDERLISLEGRKEKELVVCLLMTNSNVQKAKELIRLWLFGNDENTAKQIERIYAEQERLDGMNTQ